MTRIQCADMALHALGLCLHVCCITNQPSSTIQHESSVHACHAGPCCAVQVLTIKLDLKYWPTWELRLDAATCNWQRRQISVFPHDV